jgi:imidazolonepropionase-like amidohydrolase
MSPATSPSCVVSADRILDGSVVHTDAALVVDEGRIAALMPRQEAERRHPQATRAHFPGASIIPGLIDLHGYLSIDPDRPDPMRQMFGPNHFERAWVSARHLRRDLQAGITTVRVMGEGHALDFAAREAVRAGLLEGPDLIASGVPIAPTHSHQSDRVGFDGVEAVRHAVRANLRAGAECIKLVLTGGVNAPGDSARSLIYSDAEIAVAVEEAARANTYVAAAAHGGPAIATAMRLGVRMIEHGALMDEEDLSEIRRRGGYLVATPARFFHAEGIEKSAARSPAVLARLMKARAAQDAIMPKAIREGVRIALGSDNMHGMLHYDIGCLVRWGASPLDALRAATAVAAEAARLADRGLLAPGRRADLAVVRGDPSRSATSLAEVLRVMKEGRWAQ